ncbi:MAG: DNA polymerase III subunit alpha, partial [Candidatus Gracilibacteria bacterium]|nr:DNA polymerase III subunit alpha [Candidatus Gracilibacteria bacterium]
MSFVHLHNHTHYSILKGLPKPKDYVKKAKNLGMSAVAITDTNNIHGCHELYKYAIEEGIKPILGTEIYLQSSLDEKMFHKIVLLAKNYEGYKNIINLVSLANLQRPGDKPYITFEELSKNSKNLICLSGPISGEISYFILAGITEEKIISRIKEYEEIFPNDFYVELLYHNDIPKQKLVTDTLIELHKKYNFKVVATNDCYYINKEDKQTQDVIMALGTGHTIENPDRQTLINGDYSFLDEENMQELFGFLPSALSNTLEIANKIDIKIQTGGILIPKYELPESDQEIYDEAIKLEEKEYIGISNKRQSRGEGFKIKKLTSDEWYLRYLSYKGLNWRFGYNLTKNQIFDLIKKLNVPGLQKKLTQTSPEELKFLSTTYYSEEKKEFLKTLDKDLLDKIERLEYELVVVHEMGFDAYFLIVADYINWARNNGVPVGPGRGSAAGSLMAYLSGITDIDPLPYNLLFERFLNPARVSMPDIDTDFSDDGRDKVIEYCRKKYGADRVAQICTFGTFAARASVKDVGRVMGVDFQKMNELAKLIPEKPGTKLKDALEESLEFKNAYENPKYKIIIDNALKIEGNVRQIGVHACAVIIAPESMTNYTALSHPPKDSQSIITQYSAYPLEDLGLLKMDFLGLRNLTIIKRALKIIKNNKGVDVDILKVDRNDKKVFEVFSKGDTTGVFQFESDGMRKYLIDLAPDSFEDLIAMVSLYRPGPLAYIPTYIDRKYKRVELKYMTDDLINILKSAGYNDEEIAEEKRKLDEDLAPILDVSNGIAVYQEQLMFIVQVMAGFSLGEADLLRRGIGKKKIEIIEKLKIEFIQKSGSFKNYKPETPKYIYEEMIQPAANYSFNKSHAACYAFIAYQTAFLKAYYEAEFLTALMISDEDNMDRIVLEVGECNSKGISVLPPSINLSMKHFTYIDDKTIRFGLKAIKGIGDGPIEAIKDSRKDGKYTSLEDFIIRAGKDVINKKSLEALILSGSLDEFGERGELFKNIENII